MTNLLIAFLAAMIAGLAVGAVFGVLALPSPAPAKIAGVLAVSGSVFGIFTGYMIGSGLHT